MSSPIPDFGRAGSPEDYVALIERERDRACSASRSGLGPPRDSQRSRLYAAEQVCV